MFSVKQGASLNGLKPEMRPCLIMAEALFRKYAVSCIVTSGTDGVHSAGSLHYYGYALDFRTRHLGNRKKQETEIANKLRDGLREFEEKREGGAKGVWAVVLESTHIHVQFKPWDMYHDEQVYKANAKGF